MLALLRFGYRDPDFWLSQLSEGEYASADQGLRAAQIAVARLRDVDFASEDEPAQLSATIERLAPFLRMSGEEQRSELRKALKTRLEQAAWWEDEAAYAAHLALHRVGHTLATAGMLTGDELDGMLAGDLRRAPLAAKSLTKLIVRGLTTMGSELGRAAETVLGALPQAEDEGNSVPVWTTRARVALALAARRAGTPQDASVVSKAAIDEAATADSEHGTAAVADWFRLGPNADAVAEVLRALSGTLDHPPGGFGRGMV